MIDEKKEFISACNDYLQQYRNWYELMNYFVSFDDTTVLGVQNFQSDNEAYLSYVNWKKDFDYAYGKVYLYSNSEFGHSTMLTSTLLHFTIKALIDYDIDPEIRVSIFSKANGYFIDKWLNPVKREIFEYNSGRLKFESFEEFSESGSIFLQEVHSLDTSYNDLFRVIMEVFPVRETQQK